MKVHRNAHGPATRGFSLVELLVVIAVIGIMAAIAIPMISSINANATAAKNKRNAQNIASEYTAATVAGATLSTDTIATALAQLQTGVPGAGQFAASTFRINIDPAEATAASTATNMALSNGELTYTP